MEIKVAIVVVLYQDMPLEYVYGSHDFPIIIVDNTEKRDLKITGHNLYYFPLKDNRGIAYALNVGFEKARLLGANWILTMDQDSELPPNIIDEYRRFILEDHENVGVLAPLINMYKGESKKASYPYEVIPEALTSGSMVSMEVYDQAGGFKNKLFIDAVDFEFCYNLSTLGYKHYQINSVIMQHHLGDTKEYKLFGRHLFYVTNHNYVRHYYMQRNGLYLNKHYPEYSPSSVISAVITLFKIVFFEKDSLRKIKARYWGKRDFKNNIWGRLNHTI